MNNLSRVSKASRFLKWICTVAIFVIPIGMAIIWATMDWWVFGAGRVTDIKMWVGGGFEIPRPIPAYSLILGFFSSMIPGSLLVFAVWQLRALFGLYVEGQIFTADNARHMRRFALAVIGMTLVAPLANTLTILFLTLGNPPGHRLLAFGVSSAQIVTLFLGAVFLVIAWVMEEGRELAEDQAGIV